MAEDRGGKNLFQKIPRSSFWTSLRPHWTREAEERIFRTFSELSENKTSIMITHHISGVRESDRILVLDEGA